MNFEEKTLNSEVVFDGKVITVIRDDVELADGHKSFREVILHSGGVVILAKKDEKTIPRAIEYLQKVADLGNVDAMYRLGVCFEKNKRLDFTSLLDPLNILNM